MVEIILGRVTPKARNQSPGQRKHFHIIGPGGMGKSTLHQYLTREGLIPEDTEAAHVNPDFIKMGIPGYDGGTGSERVHLESAYATILTVNRARKQGMNIITEGTGYRLRDYKTTQDPTYEKVFHIVYLPYAEAEKRVHLRNAQGKRQLPVCQIRLSGAGLYGLVTDHLISGEAQSMYLWDMDVPNGTAPRVIAQLEHGLFQSFDTSKLNAWAIQHGSTLRDSGMEWFKRYFPAK